MSVTSAKGTKGNPYTKAEYDKMVTDSSWIGGWVRKDEVTMYITTRGNVEQDVGGRTLGRTEVSCTCQSKRCIPCSKDTGVP